MHQDLRQWEVMWKEPCGHPADRGGSLENVVAQQKWAWVKL